MRLRILLVDENPVFLASVARFLTRIPGAAIIGQLPHLHDARSLLARLHPDLILMDVTALRNGGAGLAQLLQELPIRPKVVCMSIYDEPQYRQASTELGNMFVSKANLVAELLPILEQLGLRVPQEWQPQLPAANTVDVGA